MLTNKLMGGVAAEKTYIEDVFSAYLYTGNGSSGQTITNGIDLAGKGGLIWTKSRANATSHCLIDSARGRLYDLATDTSAAQGGSGNINSTFGNSDGYTLINAASGTNASGTNYVSWTFRKAPKFFDVVTYTGDGSASQTISHALGQEPGMIIVKNVNGSAYDWFVRHRGFSYLNGTSATGACVGALNRTWSLSSGYGETVYFPTIATGSSIYVGSNANLSGVGYVAYLFAHDTSANGLIQCGSYTGNGSASGPTVSLGWEPQFLIIKNASATGNWQIIDNMRGMPVGSADATLQSNLSNAESAVDYISPTATGFQVTSTSSEVNTSGATYIYMAIRRGPMRAPTSGSTVFSPIASSAATGTKLTTNFPVDAQIFGLRTGTTNKGQTVDRLRGVSANATESGAQLITNSTAAETTTSIPTLFWDNTGFQMPSSYSGTSEIFWNFGRAPGFFDVVCYTGDFVGNRAVKHNLGVVPELILIKRRETTGNWVVWHNSFGNPTGGYHLYLNTNSGKFIEAVYFSTAVNYTNSNFYINQNGDVNAAGSTYVAYLFASCPGVSKVGSYTGNGSSQTINCGFTAGARFVLIKRTDSTGDWVVFDSARGIVAGGDPSLALNNTTAETSSDSIDPDSTGFIVNADTYIASKNPNVSGASYIYLAIA